MRAEGLVFSGSHITARVRNGRRQGFEGGAAPSFPPILIFIGSGHAHLGTAGGVSPPDESEFEGVHGANT